MKDLNDHAKDGTLPNDPAKQAEPVTPRAKKVSADERRIVSEREVIRAGIDRATAPRDERGKLTTTHWEMDRDTGGFRDRQVWFVGALSGFGKTSYTIACADEHMKEGFRPLIISGEDPKELYGERLLIRRTRADRYRFADGTLNSEELDQLREQERQAKDEPLFIDAVGKPVEWIVKRTAEVVKAEGIDVAWFDYVQCFSKEKSMDGRRAEVTYIARMLIDCLKSLGIAGGVLSQITPDEKKEIPTKEMMRESKDMGFFAEVVAMGFVAKRTIERGPPDNRRTIAFEGDRCIHLDKNKPGPGPHTGRIYKMGSDKKHGCFNVVPEPKPEERALYDFD